MLMLGPTGIPVVGEAWALPFNLQIQLDDMNWKLSKKEHRQDAPPPAQDEEAEPDEAAGGRPSLPRPESAPPFDGDQLIREVQRVQRSARYTQVERDRRVRDLITRSVREHDRARETVDERNASATEQGPTGARGGPDPHEAEELTFDFGKNADAATSQMLKMMVNKVVFPTVLITVFHRSMHAPMTLLITYENVRLKEYALDCAGDETMSDITEKWTATYKKMSFTYQNRPPLGLPYSLASGVAIAATQGRIKEFSMEERDED